MSRSAARAWGTLPCRIAKESVATSLAQALERWLGQAVRIERRTIRAMTAEPDGPPARLWLRLPAGMGEVTVCLDPRLVTRLVSFALKREASLYNPLAPIEPGTLGAMAAILAMIIEDSGLGIEVQFANERLQMPDALRVQLDATLYIGSAAYPLILGFTLKPLPVAEPTSIGRLSSLGDLALELPLVVGQSEVTRSELARLAPGTAFFTGAGLWVDESLVGHSVLIAPLAERGMRVNLEPGGKIVLDGRAVTLNHDQSKPPPEAEQSEADLTDTLLEAPVVLRIELGSVSLPARQWAMLRPGDIVETAQRLGSEVTLRVAGQALAQGELLNVEGELGVRITKLLVGEEP